MSQSWSCTPKCHHSSASSLLFEHEGLWRQVLCEEEQEQSAAAKHALDLFLDTLLAVTSAQRDLMVHHASPSSTNAQAQRCHFLSC